MAAGRKLERKSSLGGMREGYDFEVLIRFLDIIKNGFLP
jgi:hypothetical protein